MTVKLTWKMMMVAKPTTDGDDVRSFYYDLLLHFVSPAKLTAAAADVAWTDHNNALIQALAFTADRPMMLIAMNMNVYAHVHVHSVGLVSYSASVSTALHELCTHIDTYSRQKETFDLKQRVEERGYTYDRHIMLIINLR